MSVVAESPSRGAVRARHPTIALLGNPNTGKSTIFNRLTGLRQRIANYPGITVEARRGAFVAGGKTFDVLDLPGTYSLSATSPDERVVIDVLLGHVGQARPDVIVCILDASNLRRNLFLASQLAEFDLPMVLVLNQWDVARRRGITIDVDALERELGVPVLATVGTKGEGIDPLRAAIVGALDSGRTMRRIVWDEPVLRAGMRLKEAVEAGGDTLHLSEAHRMIFDCHSAVKDRLSIPAERLDALIHEGRQGILEAGLNPGAAEAVLHYAHMDRILERVIGGSGRALMAPSDRSIDALLVHRVWGSLIFLSVMWVVFQSVYAWASPFMDLIEGVTGAAQNFVSPLLAPTPVFQSLVTDGVIAGVGSVVIFVPQIFILFLFIALLEDSGYMSRAAFLMDRLFGWCGLNGKSFVPLLSSYACAIPGVMAARSLEDPKARLTTILMAPFMSCSARLPVYVLLIGAFIEPVYGTVASGWVLFGMHIVGLAVALPLAWLLNRLILRVQPLPFILEMPSYKIPDMRNVLLKMWEGGREFIIRAGTVIFAFSVVIWALLYFPRTPAVEEEAAAQFIAADASLAGLPPSALEARLQDPESDASLGLANAIEGAHLEHSFLGTFGKAVQPVFEPAGFDWKITVGVLASFPAREVIIATLGIIYNLGSDVDEESDGLRERMASETWTAGPRAGTPVFTIPVVFAILVFFALCMQCGATVAVIAKQLNWWWAIGSFVFMTALAWAAAVLIYQAGTRFGL